MGILAALYAATWRYPHFVPVMSLIFLPPLLRRGVKILAVAAIVLGIKSALSLFFVPDTYKVLELNYEALLRECVTLFGFLYWFLIGRYVLTFRRFSLLQPKVMLFVIVCMMIAIFLVSGAPFLYGIDNLIAVLYLMLFFVITSPGASLPLRTAAVVLTIGSAASFESSFTTLSAGIMLIVAWIQSTKFQRIFVDCRVFFTSCILVLLFTSFIASAINLKVEGNNGFTREILAGSALETFVTNPLFGTPFGRGIIPLKVVDQLDWSQYFDGSEEFNVYALSFHNGWWYLVTRFGVFGVIFLGLFSFSAPYRAPLTLLVFSSIPLLAISANVVVESIRAGLGVALVFGVLFSHRPGLTSWAEQKQETRGEGAAQ